MVARQAMQDQEIPDFIEHKQIVAVFDLPENAKTMVKENMGIALLPVVPQVPFFIIGAICLMKSSNRIRDWVKQQILII